ncbi:hypothetical protein AB0A98_37370 [Streptomyces chrestomyceticus]|uniref:hypothetical protein n=1 Tax=Streptomyces chrestomyceticus TaxID=68185 RepID=UPI0034042CC5
MLATAERIRPAGALGPVEIVWHRPADAACDGDCDMHELLCGERTGVPGGLREVPADLTAPEQRWCPGCLDAARATAPEEG